MMNDRDNDLIFEASPLGHRYTSQRPGVPGEPSLVLDKPTDHIWVYKPVTSIQLPDEYILVNAELSSDNKEITVFAEHKRDMKPVTLRYDADSGQLIDEERDDIGLDDPDETRWDEPDEELPTTIPPGDIE